MLQAEVRYRRSAFALDVQFELRSNWTVLFGASGVGKTTLLRLLAGLLMPDRGGVSLGQRVLVDTDARLAVAPGLRRIGFVTQQAALFPHLTARANVAFGLHSLARTEREARVEEMLLLFEAEPLGNRKPGRLSGGERQRIALARALAPRPELLLLDEPFAALDGAARVAIIENLRASGVPVLYVSHGLADAWQINADAIVLDRAQDGTSRISAQGAAREVLAPYRERLLEQLGAAEFSAAKI